MPENIDYKFLSDLEGGSKTTGYVPAAGISKSGVTIATGFDLGQRNEQDLKVLKLNSILINKLKPYLGAKGTSAQAILKKSPLMINSIQAKEIDKAVKSSHVNQLKFKYNSAAGNKKKFIDLPHQAQTVITSVSFQYGVGLSTRAPKFWKAVTTQDGKEAIKILKSFGDAYPTRRKKKSLYWENLMRAKVYLCFLFLVGCLSTSLQENKNILNDTLKVSYLDVSTSLKIKRTSLLFSNGEEVQDCKSYSLLNSKYDLDESVYNQLVKSEYLICEALDILTNATWNNEEIVNYSNFGAELRDKLDLRTFPSSFYRASSDESHTLGSMFPDKTRIEGSMVELQTDDWSLTLEVVALAQINDNSSSDWIVWVIDESKSGNYKSYSTLIIYDPEKDFKLNALKYPFD